LVFGVEVRADNVGEASERLLSSAEGKGLPGAKKHEEMEMVTELLYLY